MNFLLLAGVAVGILLSYQMPIYISRLLGMELQLRRLVGVVTNDGIPSSILFILLYMAAGFCCWAGPALLAYNFFHKEDGADMRAWFARKFWFVSVYVAPVRLRAIERYDAVTGEMVARYKLRKVYQDDFADQFLSFDQFYTYFKWLNNNQHIDPKIPLGQSFAASLDDVRDAEIMLGLGSSYGADDLASRYRVLIKQVHPDVAGPNDLVRRLTEARNIIKARKGWK